MTKLTHPVHWLAFGLGSGLAPKAPGTFGTLAALPLGIAFMYLLPSAWFLALIIVATWLGVWFCDKTSKDMGVHDHPGIVWDEWVGIWMTLWLVPLTWWTPIVAFILFRFFDIIKPWPIKWLDQRVHGGLGIMIDDMVAAIPAWLILQGLVWWLL
ncbi:phosphatidylglycerophosphatase A family protein [Salinibius halmophilus]|uniref:phosphatidylglycerophosphatase A family protein n=1 Tax=Salinibius halmophilus TaxID=1853216 RepID=UPI000E6736DB|nr:phosphatidylglycerophosphatase A [Salinibius halmophilus]